MSSRCEFAVVKCLNNPLDKPEASFLCAIKTFFYTCTTHKTTTLFLCVVVSLPLSLPCAAVHPYTIKHCHYDDDDHHIALA